MNEPLMRQVVETILHDPASLDMTMWAKRSECGTTYCVAGWACALSEREFVWRHHRSAADEFDYSTYTLPKGSTIFNGRKPIPTVANTARELLDLSERDAERIFNEYYVCPDNDSLVHYEECYHAYPYEVSHTHEVATVEQVVETIINDPSSLRMSYWRIQGDCRTTYCIAGHAAILAGLSFLSDSVVDYNGERTYVPNAAQELLGLTTEQARNIFNKFLVCDACGHLFGSGFDNECSCTVSSSISHASVRRVIENIIEVTGLEFKIPEDIS